MGSITTGWLVEKFNCALLMNYVANTIGVISLCFVAPAPFLPIVLSLEMIYACSSLMGLAFSMIVPSAVHRLYKASKVLNYKQVERTNVVLSTAWSMVFQLGCFIGPTVAGYFVEAYGFKITMLIFAANFLPIFVLNLYEIFKLHCK